MADDVVRFPKGGFRPLTEAVLDTVIEGTVADLLMASGRVYRARWGTIAGLLGKDTPARMTAWWPLSGPRKHPIGLMDPLAIRFAR